MSQQKKGSGGDGDRRRRRGCGAEQKEEENQMLSNLPTPSIQEKVESELKGMDNTYHLEVNKVPWSECFQQASAFVKCPRRDIILLLFSYLSLLDAFNLGRTCRRLYSFYRESTQSRKCLLLIDGSPCFLNYMTPNFVTTPEETGQEKQPLTELYFTSRFPLDTISRHRRQPATFGKKSVLSLHRQLFTSTLPNLTYLEIVSPLANHHLAALVQTLNELQLLETLKLFLNGCQQVDEEFDQRLAAGPSSADALLPHPGSSEKETQNALRNLMSAVSFEYPSAPQSPVYVLSLPVLKHLTMIIRSLCLFYESLHVTNGQQMTDTQKRYEIKARPNTFRLLSPQLATFRLNSNDCLRSLCGFIRQAILPNCKLTIANNPSSVQVVLHLTKSDLNVPKAKLDKCEALAYITHLKIRQEMPPTVSNLLPLLVNLSEISLTIGSAHLIDTPTTVTNGYYISVLSSLTKLVHLKSMHLYFCNSQTTPIPLAPKPPPVLPSVTGLRIEYSTTNHSDVVEQLRLVHCFPCLTTFACAFNQSYCRYCSYGLAAGGPFVAVLGPNYSLRDVEEEGYRRGDQVPNRLAIKLMACAHKLVRGLGKLKGVVPEHRKISFFFRGKETNLCYNQGSSNSWISMD